MGGLFNKVKTNVNKAVATVGVKSSNALEKSKLNTYISTLEGDIQKLKNRMADRYYEMWVAENVNFDEIDGFCQQILDKEGIIKMQQQRMTQLDAEEQQMLGKDMPEGMYCGQCGGRNSTEAKFCTHCGKPMQA